MDKLRIKQAQDLIKFAGNQKDDQEDFKPAKNGKINLNTFEDILFELIDMEDYIYSTRPSHEMDKEQANEFCNKMIKIRDNIDLILSDFGVIQQKNVEDEIKALSERFIFLTTKNDFKKIFTTFGVDVQRIIVAGVPLDVEDMKILNPKIPETAMKPIEKKIKKVKRDINRKMDQFSPENLLIISESDKAGEVLGNRGKNIYHAEVCLIDNLKDIKPVEFKDLLNKLSN
ncbi:MAG: DUF2100 domain-containing protein [Methanobacteriaceae archaeon]|nr:DUF2100 domain-containing protein [Methanobacteriaceae archaeon]